MSHFFCHGAISSDEITGLISRYGTDNNIGAYNIFLGQVRNDLVEDRRVIAIDFTSYEEMADIKISEIIAGVIKKYNIRSLHVLQSLGTVKVGEICLLVLACSAHRKAAIEACQEMVERFKKEVPVWGRELFDDDSYQWKVNTTE